MIIKRENKHNTSKLEPNDFKNIVQTDIVDDIVAFYHILLTIYTGFGKTYTTIKIIKKLLEVKPNLTVLVIVPTLVLKEAFEEMFHQHFFMKGFECKVINTIVLGDEKDYNYDLLVVDEVHHCLNRNAEYFSLAIQHIKFKYSAYLSASLKPDMKTYLNELLEQKQIFKFINYDLNLYWGVKNGLVPQFKVYNVPLELNQKEKFALLECNATLRKYQSFFAQFGIFQPFQPMPVATIASRLGYNTGQVYGMKNKWMKAFNDKVEIQQNAESKNNAVIEILQLIQEKVLVYDSKIKNIEALTNVVPNSKIYHSKLKVGEKRQILEDFRNNDREVLFSIGTLKEGVDIESCGIAVRKAYTSNEKDSIQILGRVLRIVEGTTKIAILIHFYIDDFVLRGDIIQSQEKAWLLKSLVGQKSETISLEQLKGILINRYDNRVEKLFTI